MRLCGIGLGENRIFTQHDGFKELKPVQFFVREKFAFGFLIKKPFSTPPSCPLLSPRATARICDRSISNPFSRHSGARVNNPPLMRIVHLLCQLPRGSGRKRFLTAARFHISDSGKISLCAPGP